MPTTTRRFQVEHAGCPACAARVQDALSALVTVEEITIDEETDTASVVIRDNEGVRKDSVDEALARASAGSGHEYRVKSDSWPTG